MSEIVINLKKQGKLRGKAGADFTGKPYYLFRGIPYAKPPIGNLRFKVLNTVTETHELRL